jgi:hypothetical protein
MTIRDICRNTSRARLIAARPRSPTASAFAFGIASALALDVEDVYEALESLQSERLASIDFRDPEASEAEQEWSLTGKGAAAAVEVVGFAGRVIGWPPAPPASLA